MRDRRACLVRPRRREPARGIVRAWARTTSTSMTMSRRRPAMRVVEWMSISSPSIHIQNGDFGTRTSGLRRKRVRVGVDVMEQARAADAGDGLRRRQRRPPLRECRRCRREPQASRSSETRRRRRALLPTADRRPQGSGSPAARSATRPPAAPRDSVPSVGLGGLTDPVGHEVLLFDVRCSAARCRSRR